MGKSVIFFFDGVGGYTTLLKSIVRSEKNALNYFKKSETGDWVDTGNRRADMINPVLIAEW